MLKLVLLRHGQSVWNKENKFTGWTDVGLTEKGTTEAKKAGQTLKKEGFRFKVAYTSYLTRAIKTLWLTLEEMDQMYIPVFKTWRLNEKHYGMLQGLNKIEMADKYGAEQILKWRRSFDVPPPLKDDDERNSVFDPRYNDVINSNIPRTESLKDVVKRFHPYWENEIKPKLIEEQEILIAAHGNSLRALVMYLKDMSEEEILKFNIPTGIPYVFEFNDFLLHENEKKKLEKDYFLGDPEEIKKLMEQVANQTRKK